MDIREVLKLADQLVLEQTGKPLDYLQKTVLQGALQSEKYSEIAENNHISEGHLRDVGYKLWNILSEILGETITKATLRSILTKGQFYSFSSAIGIDRVTVNNVNICPEASQPQAVPQQPQQNSSRPHLDLGSAPEIFSFYGRTAELSTLEGWIIGSRCRLVALLGVSGIGKTALTIRLIEQIKTHFDYIIYRSLRFSPTLALTLTNLLQVFDPEVCSEDGNSSLQTSEKSEPDISHNIETLRSQLLEYLRQYRCLIVLDDVQMLWSGQLAGQYKPGYEDYHHFVKLIAETPHHSCFLLNSCDRLKEVAKLSKGNHPVRSLVLGSLGVAAKELLQAEQLSDAETWETLINAYQGNPLWLELTATMISELFAGSVSEFCEYESPILCESLLAELSQQFQRLTEPERAILTHLAKEAEPIALPQLSQKTPLAQSEFLNAMQSLKMRLLLEKEKRKNVTLFALNALWKQYVQNLHSE